MIMREKYPHVTITLEVIDNLCWFSWHPEKGYGRWFTTQCANLDYTAGAFHALASTCDFPTDEIWDGEIANYLL